jgi:hypothetical protein
VTRARAATSVANAPARNSNSKVECQDSMTALSSAERGLPIDWRMPSRAQAARTMPAMHSADSTGRRNTSIWRWGNVGTGKRQQADSYKPR